MKSTEWEPGIRLRFKWPAPPEQHVIVEYVGPGWGPPVFAGRVVESTSPIKSHQVGGEATDWARDSFEPLPNTEENALGV